MLRLLTLGVDYSINTKEPLGAGSYADVYAGKYISKDGDQQAAIKVVHAKGKISEKDAEEAFEQEKTALENVAQARIDDPHNTKAHFLIHLFGSDSMASINGQISSVLVVEYA